MVNREEIKDSILKLIDKTYKNYKLPPMNISDREWDSFIDVIEAHFLAHNMMDSYSNALNVVVLRALNLSLSNNSPNFTFTHLKWALIDLSSFNIPHDEILAIRNEIQNKVDLKSNRK